MRVFLELAYDGTRYHGWQRQPHSISVQEVLEDTMAQLFGGVGSDCYDVLGVTRNASRLVDELFEMDRAAHHVELHHVTELNQSARARQRSSSWASPRRVC